MSPFSLVTISDEFLPFKEIILRQHANEVLKLDSAGLDLCKRLALGMFEIMYANDGAALAAPQVGISLRLVTMDPAGLEFGPHVLINPKILSRSESEVDGTEGCLSLPGYMGNVARSSEVSVQTYDLKGELVQYDAKDWLARVMQHEIDHLDGILYPDRLKQGERLLETGMLAQIRASRAIEGLLA